MPPLLYATLLTFVLLVSIALTTALYFRIKKYKKAKHVIQHQAKKLDQLLFRNQLLMEAQDNVLIVLGADGLVGMSNKLAKQFFQQNTLTGRHYQKIIPYPNIVAVVETAIDTGQSVQQIITIPIKIQDHPESEERTYSINITFFSDYKGTPYTRLQMTDITEQYRNEQIRKDFVANASHELRTPLAIINGYVETLLEPGAIDEQETAIRFLSVMKKHGKRLSRIIDEMLVISRLESGIVNILKCKPFRIADCINDCLERLESLIKENQVSIRIKMNDPDLTIEADRFYWTQILFNLIENSIKQNPGNNLKIKIGCMERKKKGTILVWVSDNGVGIPPEDLPFIFGRFFRVEKHHSQTEIKGTGLGLSIVKRAVEAHGGTISCRSIQNQLTKFEIALPSSMRRESQPAK